MSYTICKLVPHSEQNLAVALLTWAQVLHFWVVLTVTACFTGFSPAWPSSFSTMTCFTPSVRKPEVSEKVCPLTEPGTVMPASLTGMSQLSIVGRLAVKGGRGSVDFNRRSRGGSA